MIKRKKSDGSVYSEEMKKKMCDVEYGSYQFVIVHDSKECEAITTKQRSKLRAKSNDLRDCVIIGKEGLTQNVLNEIAVALYNRELVKVAVLQNCQTSAKDMLKETCDKLGCQPVQCIGRRFVVYKYSDKKDIVHIEI